MATKRRRVKQGLTLQDRIIAWGQGSPRSGGNVATWSRSRDVA